MFKVDLHKLHTTNYFTGVKLDLLPKEIVVYFIDKSFSFLCNEIIDYTYNVSRNEDICIHLKGIRETFQIVIKPYKSEHFRIICHHLDSYCKNRLKYTINPIYNRI